MSHQDNPYRSPDAQVEAEPSPRAKQIIATKGTITPRHIAATMDNFIAMILGVLAAKLIASGHPITQAVLFLIVYLGYFILFESLLHRTLGKMLTGLMVVGLDGAPCTRRQTLIRTFWRLIEVNPMLLGAIPASLSIIFSEHQQRLGDRIAGTIVVPTHRVKRSRKAKAAADA